MDINQLISRAAHADGDHDFGKLGPHSDLTTFKESVLNDPGLRVVQDEESTFNSIGPPTLAGQDLKTSIIGLQEGSPALSLNTYTGKRFTVKYIDLEGKTGDAIVTAGGFNNAALIVDTHQHDFFGKLKSGPSVADKSIHYVYTPEVENDPATKTRTSDPIFSKSGAGVNLTSYLQLGNGPIVYTGNKPFDLTKPTQDFYSKYTYSLSGIQQVGFFKKIMKQRVSVSVTNDTGSMIQESPDAKVSNSIKSLLKTFLSKLWGNKKPADKFNIASAWVRKRGGDWLQVLACLDLKNRKYDKPLPVNVQPFFMTIDYIALSYALLMGVDTIFFPAGRTGILIFNQNAAPPDPAARLEACKGILSTAGKDRINEVSRFLATMTTVRKTVLDARKSLVSGVSLNSRDREGLKTQCMELFKQSLHYAHAHFDFPDVTQISNDLTSQDPCIAAQGYLMGRGIYDLHKGVAKLPESFARLFEGRDEFKSLGTWANGMNSRITRRIGQLVGGKNNKDVYTFLAYISRVPRDDDIRKTIVGKFDTLKQSIPSTLDAETKAHVLDTCTIVSGFLTTPDFGSAIDFTLVNKDAKDPMNVKNIVQAVEDDEMDGNKMVIDLTLDEDMDQSLGGRRRRRTRRKVKRGGWEDGTRFKGISTLFPNSHTLYPLIGAQIASMGGGQPVQVVNGQMVDDLPQSGGATSVIQFLPIFAMLEAISTQIGPRMENHPDLPLYNHLFLFLKMAIPEVEKNPEVGYALREVLFTMVQTATGRPVVESALGSTTAFSLACSSMSEYICGEFVGLDEAPGIALLQRADIASVLKTLYTNSEAGEQIDLETVLAEKQAVSLKITGETLVEKQVPGAPMKPARVRSESIGDPIPISFAGRRRTRRLTNDFLQSVRHQSIKMSSKRHSLSGRPARR
jgi:hypothetical protein